MPRWITAVFVFFLSTTLLTARAKTVEDVISQYQLARGGMEKGVARACLETRDYRNAGSPGKEEETSQLFPKELALQQYNSLFYFLQLGSKPELLGIDTAAAVHCFHVKIMPDKEIEIHYYINPENGQLVRLQQLQKPVSAGYEINYSDYYANHAGILFPRTILVKKNNGRVITFIYQNRQTDTTSAGR